MARATITAAEVDFEYLITGAPVSGVTGSAYMFMLPSTGKDVDPYYDILAYTYWYYHAESDLTETLRVRDLELSTVPYPQTITDLTSFAGKARMEWSTSGGCVQQLKFDDGTGFVDVTAATNSSYAAGSPWIPEAFYFSTWAWNGDAYKVDVQVNTLTIETTGGTYTYPWDSATEYNDFYAPYSPGDGFTMASGSITNYAPATINSGNSAILLWRAPEIVATQGKHWQPPGAKGMGF